MTPGLITVAVCVLVALAVGVWRARTDGRFRGDRPALAAEQERPEAAEPPFVAAERLGERATLLQFSSAFCAPCRATRQVLGEVAALVPGVAHVELDAEDHLDLVRRAGVLRTPTTLVLDAAGREVTRAAGAPRREQVLAALAPVVGPDDGQASRDVDETRG